MKKTMIISLVALCAFMTTSCSGPKTYDVTVIGHSEGFLTGVQKAAGLQNYDAVTASGDTVEVYITEEILLNHKIPFKAKMEKSEISNTGKIVSAE
jgi:hypothetical protein